MKWMLWMCSIILSKKELFEQVKWKRKVIDVLQVGCDAWSVLSHLYHHFHWECHVIAIFDCTRMTIKVNAMQCMSCCVLYVANICLDGTFTGHQFTPHQVDIISLCWISFNASGSTERSKKMRKFFMIIPKLS